MKNLSALLVLTFIFVSAGCIKHEIIPPPLPEVELNSIFTATINGEEVMLRDGVDGMEGNATQIKEIFPSPQPSTVVYYAEMRSDLVNNFIQLAMGKLAFQPEESLEPSKTAFESYFVSNIEPNFSQEANSGVMITYVDTQGIIWRSDSGSEGPKSFIFSSLEYDEDDRGEYMKFTANFTCNLYNNLTNPTESDTLVVENAVYTNYFKR